jgi:DNA-binding Lrp family transcriptional regulator
MLMALTLALGVIAPAAAERMTSKPENAAASRAADIASIRDTAARDGVRQALEAHGLSQAEVQDRLERLSNEDLQRLAANVDQVQSAGAVPQYIWILLAVFLAVSIIVMIV